MDSLNDTQSERDTRGLAISHAGVRGLRYPVTVRRPDGTEFATVATAALTASLAADRRGTHMSRFVEALHAVREELHPAGVIELARNIRRRLDAAEARAELRLPWFIAKQAPVTGGTGFLEYEVTWAATTAGANRRLETTLRVPVGTLCPCSKAISERGAHNQRGWVTLTAETTAQVWPDSLIAVIESAASCELYSVLKRADEKFVTERAYDSPVFVEDLVRDIAVRLRRLKGVHPRRIEAENLESIHSHNAFAVIDYA